MEAQRLARLQILMKTFNYLTIVSLVTAVFSITVLAIFFPVDVQSKKTRNLFVSVYVPDDFKPKSGPKRIAYSGMVGVDSVQSLDKAFLQENYSINSTKNGEVLVPRIYLTQLPKSFLKIKGVKKRKALFLKVVLPLILKVNYDILVRRKKLINIYSQFNKLGRVSDTSKIWLLAMEKKYKVKRGGAEELLRRMDLVPPSLALAQAAEESGWGTSRFVMEGNALFGQWTLNSSGGMIPNQRSAMKKHKVKKFSTLIDGVRAYALNLNTHGAYRVFRLKREKARKASSVMTGIKLSKYLKAYSERGLDYITTIQKIIRTNRLGQLDKARLRYKKLDEILPWFRIETQEF